MYGNSLSSSVFFGFTTLACENYCDKNVDVRHVLQLIRPICWAGVEYGGLILKQHGVNVLYLLSRVFTL